MSRPLGGKQAPGDPTGSSCQSDNPRPLQPPARLERGEAAGPGGGWGEAEWGKGRHLGRPRPLPCHWAAAAGSAPPFLHPTQLGQGLVWPRPLTSPPSLQPLGAPRVAAATVREAGREWQPPLTGLEEQDSTSSHPGRAREQFRVARRTPRGVDCWALAFWLPLRQRDSGEPRTGRRGSAQAEERTRKPGQGGTVSCRSLERTELSSIGAGRPLTRMEQRMHSH